MDQFTKKRMSSFRRFFIRRGKNNEGEKRWVVWERISLTQAQVRGLWTTKPKAKRHMKLLNNQRLG